MSNMRRHPANETELLLYADGELRSEATIRLHSHLSACADCRAELEDRESVLGSYRKLRDSLGLALVSPLPNSWEPLDARIDAWENRPRFGFLFGRLRGIGGLRYGLTGALALLLIALSMFLRTWQTTVSANQLLRHARIAQSQSPKTVARRLLHELLEIRFRIRLRDDTKPSEATTLAYESWQDPSGKLLREKSSSALIVTELQHVYQANGLDWKSPLSAAAYEAWRSTLTEKHDSVAHLDHGQLMLTTVAGKQHREDAIYKAQLVVRETDWRPVVVRLWTRDREYEIAELKVDTPPLSTLEPVFSEPLPFPQPTPAPAVAMRKKLIAGGAPAVEKNNPSLNVSNSAQGAGNEKDASAISAAETINHASPAASSDRFPVGPAPRLNLNAPSEARPGVRPGTFSQLAPESNSPAVSPHQHRFHVSPARPQEHEEKPVPKPKPRKPGG